MTPADKNHFKPTPNLRARRRQTLVKVELLNSRNEPQDVMVQDVSSTGLRATARNTPPNPNEMVTVRLPDGNELWGLVRWVEAKQFGVEFDVSTGQIDLTGSGPDAAQIDYRR